MISRQAAIGVATGAIASSGLHTLQLIDFEQRHQMGWPSIHSALTVLSVAELLLAGALLFAFDRFRVIARVWVVLRAALESYALVCALASPAPFVQPRLLSYAQLAGFLLFHVAIFFLLRPNNLSPNERNA